MQNFVVITNPRKDSEFELTKRIVSYIERNGGKACYFHSFEFEAVPEDTECVLVLGGDGTLIRAATKLETLQIPLVGVNLGTVGYLCELEEQTVWKAIDALLEDKYMVEERVMLTGKKANTPIRRMALNDIVIHRHGNLSILRFYVYVNGELLTSYDADGIIVATPTGSTGYSMSAGGPIVDPNADMILLTPINAHNLNSKSLVLQAESRIEIEIGSRRAEKDESAAVSFDGDTVEQLFVGDRFLISKADHTTLICKFKKESFLENLRKKMETYT